MRIRRRPFSWNDRILYDEETGQVVGIAIGDYGSSPMLWHRGENQMDGEGRMCGKLTENPAAPAAFNKADQGLDKINNTPDNEKPVSAPQALAIATRAPLSKTVPVPTSRALTEADDGQVLDCAAGVTLTVPITLPAGFACGVIPTTATTVASGGGALLNGVTANQVRAAADNRMFSIVARAAANSYIVTGV